MWDAVTLTTTTRGKTFGATPESQGAAVTGSAACRSCAGLQRNGYLWVDARVIRCMALSQSVTGKDIRLEI